MFPDFGDSCFLSPYPRVLFHYLLCDMKLPQIAGFFIRCLTCKNRTAKTLLAIDSLFLALLTRLQQLLMVMWLHCRQNDRVFTCVWALMLGYL